MRTIRTLATSRTHNEVMATAMKRTPHFGGIIGAHVLVDDHDACYDNMFALRVYRIIIG